MRVAHALDRALARGACRRTARTRLVSATWPSLAHPRSSSASRPWSRSGRGCAAPGDPDPRWYTRAVPASPFPSSGAMSFMTSRPLTVAVVGATGVVGRTMISVLLERAFPMAELQAPRVGSLSGDDRPGRRSPRRRGGGDAGGVRGRRHRALLGRCGCLARAGAAGRRPWLHGDRQLERVADGARDPARRQPGQPRRPRDPRRHHREPELQHDAARAAPDGAARRPRPRARRRGHVPGCLGDGRRRDRGAGDPDPRPRGGRPEGGLGLPAPDRLQRAAGDRRVPRERLHEGGMEGRLREPQDPPPARPAGLLHGGPGPGLHRPLRGGARGDAARP